MYSITTVEMGDKCECSKSRGISLLSVVGKLSGRVLIKRVRARTECAIWELGSNTIDRHGMKQMLRVYGAGGKLLKAVQSFYVDSRACAGCVIVGLL